MSLHSSRLDANAVVWFNRIRAEYREMPGLSLTQPQMRRLWGFEEDVCATLVDSLVAAHILRRTPEGSFVVYED